MQVNHSVKKFLFIALFALSATIYADSFLTPVTDAVNKGIINTKIAMDSSLSGADVNVNVNHGYVTLTGSVNSDSEEKRIIQIAQSVSGINGVDVSKLTVIGSNQPLSDTAITAQVKALFIRESLFGKNTVPVISINVSTNNGIVSLTGSAANNDQISNAIKIAKSVSGVKAVESQVVVK